MKQMMEEGENGLRLAFSGELTIPHATGLREALLDLMARGRDACIDLGGVTDIDVSAMQLLCSLHRTAVSRGMAVTLERGMPDNLVEAIRTAGYLREKGCRLDVPGTCIWKGVALP